MKLSKIFTFCFGAVMIVLFTIAQAPTTEKKEARGLEFSQPVETPDGVWFSWSNASSTQTHSIYRRMSGTYGNWERIAMNLTGVNGGTMVMGFTLDTDFDYEFREDLPE